MKNWIKEGYHLLTLRFLFPVQYARYCRRPVEKGKVVFAEANLPTLSNSLRYLYEELGRQGMYQLKVHCLQEIYVSKGVYIRNVMRFLKDLATAEYLFLCEGSRVVSCISPRKETVIVQVWHGCGAFKKFGFSTSELKFGGSRKENLKYPYYKNFDVVTVSSPEVVWAYEEAMNLLPDSGIVRPLGISRTDLFFREPFIQSSREKVFRSTGAAPGKKILLYAPTFRGSVGGAKAPDALDLRKMKAELGEQYILLIKHHPVVKRRPHIPEDVRDFAMDVTETLEIEELMCASDVCISDYSSLIFEYSLFERPMVFFAFDLEEYGDWRGFYYDYDELTPGPVVRTTEELIHYLANLDTEFDRQRVRAFRDQFMSACDGHATERLMELLRKRRKI